VTRSSHSDFGPVDGLGDARACLTALLPQSARDRRPAGQRSAAPAALEAQDLEIETRAVG